MSKMLRYGCPSYPRELYKYLSTVRSIHDSGFARELLVRKEKSVSPRCEGRMGLTDTTLPTMRIVCPTYFSRKRELIRGVGFSMVCVCV